MESLAIGTQSERQTERRRSVLAQSIVSGPVKFRRFGRSSEMNIQRITVVTPY